MSYLYISDPISVDVNKPGVGFQIYEIPGIEVPIPSGARGLPGFSPIVTVTTTTNGHQVNITDNVGTTSFDVLDGAQGSPGIGIASGGTTGQVLAKKTNTDYDTEWVNQSGNVTSVNGQTGDVVISVPSASTTTPSKDGTGAAGDGTTWARSNHVHPLNVPSSGTPADLGTASNGSATSYARSDHVHKMPTASDVGALPSSTTIPSASSSTPADLGTAAVGTSSKYARADHVHKRPAASDVGAMGKWKLLWTNSSPSSSFSAKTVALSLSGYNLVYVEAYVPDFSCLVGGFGVVGASYRTQLFSAVNGRHVRNFTASTSGVTFTKGESAGGQTQGVSDNNATMIPYKIYGIKGME